MLCSLSGIFAIILTEFHTIVNGAPIGPRALLKHIISYNFIVKIMHSNLASELRETKV